MLVLKCKIKLLIITQLTYISYHFKADSLYVKFSWIIKGKETLIGLVFKCKIKILIITQLTYI